MSLVLGTNCGFVSSAPSSDPSGYNQLCDNLANSIKDTSSATATTVTEIGWWCDSATQEANFEVGLYDHDSGDNEPDVLLDSNTTNAKGTTAGWKAVTGLNISIDTETIYWIAFQLDNTSSNTNTNFDFGGARQALKTGQSTLPEPWGDSSNNYDDIIAIYAVWEAAAAGDNTSINIGDDFKSISAMQINIGDSWKTASAAFINIGDSWKTAVFA